MPEHLQCFWFSGSFTLSVDTLLDFFSFAGGPPPLFWRSVLHQSPASGRRALTNHSRFSLRWQQSITGTWRNCKHILMPISQQCSDLFCAVKLAADKARPHVERVSQHQDIKSFRMGRNCTRLRETKGCQIVLFKIRFQIRMFDAN